MLFTDHPHLIHLVGALTSELRRRRFGLGLGLEHGLFRP